MSAVLEDFSSGSIPGVTEVVSKIRASLERSFPFIWVRGEVTDFSRSAAGHIYFSLKDDLSLLNCVWFSGKQNKESQKFNPLTGEVYDTPRPSPANFIKNGMELVCAGAITMYAAGGRCQMVVEFVELAGIGLLAQAFEALRQMLAARGLFDRSHKKKLPVHPGHVALLTSLHGAALHDFLRIAQTRGVSSTIRIFSVPVQGNGAAEKIMAAIRAVNSQNWADVIALVRGGGSQEDLWCFNDENLVQTIYDSTIPVLTGIGHEIDLSLSDLAADASAATPSHAAQLLWPLRLDLEQTLDNRAFLLVKAIQRQLENHEMKLKRLEALLQAHSPLPELNQRVERLLRLQMNLVNAAEKTLQKKDAQFNNVAKALVANSFIARINNLEANLSHLQSRLLPPMNFRFDRLSAMLDHAVENLAKSVERSLEKKMTLFERLESVFLALNPDNLLQRGYALVFAEGLLIKSVKSLRHGEKIIIRMADGEVDATVTGLKPKKRSD